MTNAWSESVQNNCIEIRLRGICSRTQYHAPEGTYASHAYADVPYGYPAYGAGFVLSVTIPVLDSRLGLEGLYS